MSKIFNFLILLGALQLQVAQAFDTKCSSIAATTIAIQSISRKLHVWKNLLPASKNLSSLMATFTLDEMVALKNGNPELYQWMRRELQAQILGCLKTASIQEFTEFSPHLNSLAKQTNDPSWSATELESQFLQK